jgi:anaerobic magnesium-protoporphyrin IX monomethyl ester cyclase
MKIALLNMSSDIRTIGLLNVSTYLRKNKVEHSFVYFLLPIGTQEVPTEMTSALEAYLQENQFDLVGLTVGTIYFNVARQMTASIRKVLPGAFVIWGGMHPTVAPEESLQYSDAICVGEGEEAFLEFIRGFERKEIYQISNIYVNTDAGVKTNELRHLVEDLDTRPYPQVSWQNTGYWHSGASQVQPLTLEVFERYSPRRGSMYDIMASRGCPFTCTYCCNSVFKTIYRGKGKLLRFRSVDHLIAELKYAIDNFPAIKIFNFEDDAFGSAPEAYLQEFSEKYIEKIHKPFHIRILPTMISENKLALLKKAGLVSAVMGLQASDRVNKTIYKRPTTREAFLRTARLLRKYEIAGRFDVIIDNPYEDENDMREVIRTFEAAPKPYKLDIFSLAFLPFTELTRKAIADGTFSMESSGYVDAMNARAEHMFPDLFRILEMTPYTPKFVIDALLAIKNKKARTAILSIYYNVVYKLEKAAMRVVLKSSTRILITKKLVYWIMNIGQLFRRKASQPAGD